MQHIGILKPDTIVKLLNGLGLPVAVIYIVCMVIFPWIDGHGDWGHVQGVWDTWQSLNVGMLAFVSSITAFNISRFNANKQRERDFLAAKAFLPDALSELCSYFKSSASILIRAWDADPNTRLVVAAPRLPDDYKDVFRQCIRYAKSDVGDFLSRILVLLQVHDSRLREFVHQYDNDEYISPDRLGIITYLYGVAELQALVNKLFPFSRNMEDFDSSRLEWENFRNAYANLGVRFEEFVFNENRNLESFTKRRIDRNQTNT